MSVESDLSLHEVLNLRRRQILNLVFLFSTLGCLRDSTVVDPKVKKVEIENIGLCIPILIIE